MAAGRAIAGCFFASLLFVAGCSTSVKGVAESSPSSTTTSTSTTTSASSSSTGSATPSASKEGFCRDLNAAVGIFELPGTSLNETQTADMIKALQGASNGTPADVPADITAVIVSMLADLQAPAPSLPPSFSTNGEKLATYAASYCG